jgi:hypothetical protein
LVSVAFSGFTVPATYHCIAATANGIATSHHRAQTRSQLDIIMT